MAQANWTTSESGNTCYVLYPASGNSGNMQQVIYSQAVLLADFVNSFVSLQIYFPELGDDGYGCYYVAISPICENVNNYIYYPTPYDVCGTISTFCYALGGTGIATYVNSSGNLATMNLPGYVCSQTTPSVSTNGTFGVYPLELPCEECGITGSQCYVLTNCNNNTIQLNTQSASFITPYVLNQTVKLVGYEGCWTVDLGVECTCLLDLSIQTSYDDCEACLPIIAYKIVNCEKSNEVKYSDDQLTYAQYVGKTIVLEECGGCWSVEQIDYTPPTLTSIPVVNHFDNCTSCLRKYYTLTDCQGQVEPLVTYTDLQSLLGLAVKLKNQSTCYTVTALLNPSYIESSTAIGVSVTNHYAGNGNDYLPCEECLETAACDCTRVKNNGTLAKLYTYVDCNNLENSITLAPGSTSDRFCLSRWITYIESTDSVTALGSCVEVTPTVFTCPVSPTGRLVTPGYMTPSCSIEQYEKITCKSSEILYKQVMQLRYGISNCCPDEDEKWLIKKEVIDIKALTIPEYDCTPVNDCCSPSPCQCNSCIS